MRRFRFGLLISFCLSFSAMLGAQSAPVTQITLGQSIVALNGPWKFHIGDNPQWASQNFDDSQWETVDLTPESGAFDPNGGQAGYVPGWTGKGHPRYWGYAWYRIRVRVTARPGEKLALAGPTDVDDAYQFFANGALLGSFGKFPASGKPPAIYYTEPEMFLLPQLKTSSGGGSTGLATQVLAFRVWMEPYTMMFELDAGGLHNAPLLGEASVVAAHYQLAWLQRVRAGAWGAVEAALFFLLAILACSLVLFDRTDRVYLWLAGVFLVSALGAVNLCVAVWTQVESATAAVLVQEVFQIPLVLGGWVMVWWVWFRLRRPTWMPRAIAVLTLLYMLSNALGEDLFIAVIPHPVSAAFHLVSLGIRLLFLLLLIRIVSWGIRQQGREAWLTLPAVVLVGIALFQDRLAALHIRAHWFPFGVSVGIGEVAYLTLVVAVFALLLRRPLLSVRRQRELALDVKQAGEVQRVLIPERLPNVPGLAIESEYRPAREVGGDFFQIIPDNADGSALVVAGDVTGKGLQAGMLVALIVGAIRNETAHTSDPLAVLNALNRTLCGRGHAHATCLALRIAADGAVTLANVGHLPPYLNSNELPMEGALPLGMISFAEFSVMHFQLEPGDRLMLMSDGIVEAQDENGQLFGFERIQALLQKPVTAAEVATAAQTFGQEDDISVLRIVRTGQAVKTAGAEPALAMR